MKPSIHPDYHEITIKKTDGSEYKTRSTYGAPGAVLQLDVDNLTHPAWTGGEQKLRDGGRYSKFSAKFAGLSIAKK